MKDRNKCHRILMGVLIITRAFTISYNKKTHQNDVKKTYLLLLIRSFKGEKGAIFCLLPDVEPVSPFGVNYDCNMH